MLTYPLTEYEKNRDAQNVSSDVDRPSCKHLDAVAS